MRPRLRVGVSARYLTTDEDRGLNRYTVNLLKALQAIGEIEFVLLTQARTPVHERFLNRLRCPAVASPVPSYILWEQIGLPAAMRRLRLDLLHTPADDAGTPQWKPCPVVLTCHLFPDKNIHDLLRRGILKGSAADYMDLVAPDGWRSRLEEWRFHLLRALALRAADRIITVSEFACRELQQLYGIPAEKLRVVYEAPAPEFCRPLSAPVLAHVRQRYGLPSQYLLCVGGFDRRKNLDGLLKAYAALRQRGVTLPLLIVAEGGNRARVERRAADLGLADPRVCHILQGIHGKDLVALYQGATLFITLSWYETFCFPVAEAMACGLPIVASSFGAIPEIMSDGGIQVDPRDPRQVAEAVEQVLSDHALSDALRARARRRAARFSWEQTAQHTWQVYEELLGNRLRHA